MNFINPIHQKDNILNVWYIQYRANAKELSKYLKNDLIAKGIDYSEFNSHTNKNKISWQREDTSVTNPPNEIYEYQNFFLLKDKSEYVLLDGFRRLLWYSAPDIEINVRVYDRTEITDSQILGLMMNLNHFKFYGGGEYHDRGFALLLKRAFDLNITDYIGAFNAYLSSDNHDVSYSSQKEGTEKNIVVKERILNKHFLDDIRFIEECKEHGVFVTPYFGALVFKQRTKTEEKFDSTKFIELQSSNKVLLGLLEKAKALTSLKGTREEKLISQIQEIYKKFFQQMAGAKTGLSYAEQKAKCVEMVNALKKDKGWISLTVPNIKEIQGQMLARIMKGEQLFFKCIVFPNQKSNSYNGDDKINIPSGIYDDLTYKVVNVKGSNWMLNDYEEVQVKFQYMGNEHKISHKTNFSDYTRHITKHYEHLLVPFQSDYHIHLFLKK